MSLSARRPAANARVGPVGTRPGCVRANSGRVELINLKSRRKHSRAATAQRILGRRHTRAALQRYTTVRRHRRTTDLRVSHRTQISRVATGYKYAAFWCRNRSHIHLTDVGRATKTRNSADCRHVVMFVPRLRATFVDFCMFAHQTSSAFLDFQYVCSRKNPIEQLE